MQSLGFLIVTPLMVLNLFGGIVSGIWLAVLGEWSLIIKGIAATVIAPFPLGLVLLPSLVFVIPAAPLIERGRIIMASPFILMTMTYTVGVISVWCAAVFYYFMYDVSSETAIPTLIWSYGVAVGPWTFLGQKDLQSDPNSKVMISVFFAQVGYIVTGLIFIFGGSTIDELAIIFFGIMMIAILIQFLIALIEERHKARYF
jgi:hypothetical protein